MIEPNFANLVLGIAVVEGLGRSLDPNADIIRVSIPILLRARMKRGTGDGDAFPVDDDRDSWEALNALDA